MEEYLYTTKEVLFYINLADKLESAYFKLPVDHEARISWWEIKQAVETLPIKEQELFRLLCQGFTAEEIAFDMKLDDATYVYQMKYAMVREIIKQLNQPNTKG